jgi:hypothetical protein
MAALVTDEAPVLMTIEQHQAALVRAGALDAAAGPAAPHLHLPPLHRRVLRFVFGGLARAKPSDSSGDASPRQQQHQQPRRHRRSTGGDGELLLLGGRGAALSPSLQGSSLCGCSDDECASEDVLGMSPFASCADLQNYRAHLQQQRAARLADAADAAARARRDAAQRAGPLRHAAAWLVRALRGAARHVSPQGPGNNDSTLFERVVNVATSVPFLVVGVHSLR